ncbi:glycosyltransferase family 4 protein [Vibrio mimicus]
MRVLCITPSLAKCGPNVVVSEITKSLNNSKNDSVDLMFLDDKCQGVEFQCDTKKFSWSLLKDYLTGNLVFNYDVVHSHGFRPDIIAVLIKIILILKSKNKHVRFVTTIHNYVFKDLYYSRGVISSIFFGALWSFLWMLFDNCVVLSEHAKKYYWFLGWKSIVINNGTSVPDVVNKFDLRGLFNIPKDSILIGCCANITKIKGLDIIINSLSKDENIYFFIMGEGVDKNNLIDLVNSLNLENKVFFLSSSDYPYSFIASLDIFVVPSRSEGFGLTIVEAALLGIPVILSNIPIFKELFIGLGNYIELKPSRDIIETIKETYSSKSKISEVAISIVENKFTSQVMVERYSQLYRYPF